MFFLVTVQAKCLYVIKGVRLLETGKFPHFGNMVQRRCFRENQTTASAALVSVAFKGFQFQVRLTRSTSGREEIRFPFIIFQIDSFSRFVSHRSFIIERHFRVSESDKSLFRRHFDASLKIEIAVYLRRRDVVFTTNRLNHSPMGETVQQSRHRTVIMRDFEVV